MTDIRAVLEAAQQGSQWARGVLNDDPDLWLPTPSEMAASVARYHRERHRELVPTAGEGHLVRQVALAFHERAGTDLPAVRAAIEGIGAERAVLRLAHQPIMLPYLGVLGQFILMNSIAQALQLTHGIESTQLYQCVDYDSMTERRLTTSWYPDAGRRDGLFALGVGRPRSRDEVLQLFSPVPAGSVIRQWSGEVSGHLQRALPILRRARVGRGLIANAARTMAIIEDELLESQRRARNFAEFTAIFLSRIVNGHWNLPTLFAMSSDLVPHMGRHFDYVFARYSEAAAAANHAASALVRLGVDIPSGVLPNPQTWPVWYLCQVCHVRIKLRSSARSCTAVVGVCHVCGSPFAVHREDAAAAPNGERRFIPRVLMQDLLDIVALRVSGGVGYVGNAEHAIISRRVARALGLPVPPEFLWRPRAVHGGVAEYVCAAAATGAAGSTSRAWRQSLRLVGTGRASGLYYLANPTIESLLRQWQSRLAVSNDIHGLHTDTDADLVPSALAQTLRSAMTQAMAS